MDEYDGALQALRQGQVLRESLESLVNPIQSNVFIPSSTYTSSSWAAYKSDAATKVEDQASVGRCSYIYQRMDFDEGMHSYKAMEKIDGNNVIEFEEVNGLTSIQVRHDVIQATLVFNVGQVHRRRGEFDVAASIYENALGMLTSVDFDQYELLISILHNIGQLQYRRGELSSAMETYNLALSHAKSMPDGTLHVAAALNCLGVLHYHANSCSRRLWLYGSNASVLIMSMLPRHSTTLAAFTSKVTNSIKLWGTIKMHCVSVVSVLAPTALTMPPRHSTLDSLCIKKEN
jgi:tetratricopeptide (TPR) repeat protein